MKHFSFRGRTFGSRSRRHARILPGLALAIALGLPILAVFSPSAPVAKGDDAGAPDPIPNQEATPTATPTPTPPPDGDYVFDGIDVVESEDDSHKLFNSSAGTGSLSVDGKDGFEAGSLGTVWVDGTFNKSATFIYKWHWETTTGSTPKDYIPSYTSSYDGDVSSSHTGGSSAGAGISFADSIGGTASSSGGHVSKTTRLTGESKSGSPGISESISVSLGSTIRMTAHEGKVKGQLNHSASGTASIAY